jgi:putative addiction module CopG family antidote
MKSRSKRAVPKVDVLLTPDLQQFVAERIARGLSETESDVVTEALRLLKARDEQTQLRADVHAGFDQLARGEGHTFDKVSSRRLVEDIKARGRSALAKP